jgi:cell division protein FtsN
MPRNEDGEFELILGNKQLLSVFFIVVTLLAVFFAMGFIMGRSVNPVAEARKVDNGPSDKPIVVDAKPSPSSGTTAANVRPVEIKAPVEPEKKAEPKTKAQEPPAKKDPEPEPKKTEAKKPEPKKPEPPPVPAGKAGPGTYLQVAAVFQAEAELVSELLGKKGFRTAIIPVEGKPELRRVLVGPVKAGAEQSKTMDDLKAAGFKPFPRKL